MQVRVLHSPKFRTGRFGYTMMLAMHPCGLGGLAVEKKRTKSNAIAPMQEAGAVCTECYSSYE